MASHHFIGWFAILTGLPAFLFVVLYGRNDFRPWEYAGVALLLLGAGLFPLGWLLGSWHYLGSPFAFLANQDKANAVYMQYEPKLDFPPFLLYPKLYWNHAALLVFPALASVTLAPASSQFRKRASLLSFVFVFLLLFSLRAQTSGYYAVRERYVALFYALTFPLTGATIADLLQVSFSPRMMLPSLRRMVMGAVALFAVAWSAFNVNMAYRFSEFDNSGGWPNDALAVGYWLKRELTRHQALTPDEAQGPIGFLQWNSDGSLRDFVAYAAGAPDEIRTVPFELWPGKIPAEFRILITNAQDDSPDFHQITAIGQWRVLRRG